MALRILNRSFSGGEITPELFGRLDLSKVQEALALCRNFITLPHGPAINRPGTEFVQEVKDSTKATRLIPFSYSNDQTFAIQAGEGYFRFHSQGGTLQCGTVQAYVPSVAVTISNANPAVVTWTGHGLSANATVSFTSTGALPVGVSPGVTYYVANPATNTFELATASDGNSISTAAASATVTISIASPGVITWNGHGLANGAAVAFSTTGVLPAGITAGTVYYVVAATTNTFEVSATPGGAAINTSGTQSGTQTCGVLTSATVTISIATPGAVSWTNHGLANGTAVVFGTTGALPTGITAGTAYYVVAATANAFEIAATPGGAAINTSGTQSGTQTCSASQGGTHTGSYAYTVGNLASSNGGNYYCIAEHVNQPPPNTAVWYAMPGTGATGIYEMPNPYNAADLMDMHYTQSADVLTLVHPKYPIMELKRYGDTDWRLVEVKFAPTIEAPVGTASAGSPTSHQYVVTAIVRNSRRVHSGGGTHVVNITWETVASTASAAVMCDLTQQGAYITLSWAPATGATGYRVYKLIGGAYQFIGAASGTSFMDTQAISARANASRNPPASSPYLGAAPGQPTATAVASTLSTLNVTPSGNGTPAISYSYVVTAMDADGNESYASSPATCQNNLAVAGTKNTVSWPSVDNAQRYNVYKQSYGLYGFIGQVGKGATSFDDNNITADISRTPPVSDINQFSGTDDYPAAVAYYQQRRVFGGTNNQPENVWATRSGTESDMNYTIPSRDDNRLAFRIAARQGSNIRHIVPLQDMLFFSESCEWRCSSSTGVLTPATINVQPQSYIGANNVQPVVVGNSVLYGAARGGHIRQMGYNWQISGYQSTDASIFAPHLFDYNTIVDMAYSRGPIPILWCVSSTGKLLGMTWLPEQQISAWHQHDTGNGDVFESLCTISENGEDMLYAVVRRTIGAATKRYVERLHTRLYSTLSDAHYVDCGSTYINPASNTGTFSRTGPDITCTITNHGLTGGQAYWFSFSDNSYGALPTGTQYTVSNVSTNAFTVTIPVATVTITIASPAVITWNGHGFAAGDPVAFSTTGTLPAGITAGVTYYVANPAANSFQIAATPGGSAIATSGTQSGVQSCYSSAGAASGSVTHLPHSFSGLAWLEGMSVNILADGAVLPQQTVVNGTITLPVGASQVHIGLPITAQLQTPPAAQAVDGADGQGLPKNINKAFLRVYRSSGILAGPDFNSLAPYRQRSTESPGSAPNMVSDEVEIVLDAAWGASGQVCVQQSDPLPLDITAITLEVATGGGV